MKSSDGSSTSSLKSKTDLDSWENTVVVAVAVALAVSVVVVAVVVVVIIIENITYVIRGDSE